MSIGSFFAKFEKFFVKIFKAAPTWEQRAMATVNYIAPALEVILGLTDPEAVPVVTPVIHEIKTDLATLAAVSTSTTVTPGTSAISVVQTVLNGIETNLSDLLDMIEIKNSTKRQQITAEVSGIIDEVKNLVGSLPTTTTSTS